MFFRESCKRMRDINELKNQGFTDSGQKRYLKATRQYCNDLFTTAIDLAKSDKDTDTDIEVTHEHVRNAAIALMKKRTKSSKQVILHIGEYLFTALAGLGSGNLSETWGILLFGISLALGVICFVSRIFKENS